jgi:hypothetical protein
MIVIANRPRNVQRSCSNRKVSRRCGDRRGIRSLARNATCDGALVDDSLAHLLEAPFPRSARSVSAQLHRSPAFRSRGKCATRVVTASERRDRVFSQSRFVGAGSDRSA